MFYTRPDDAFFNQILDAVLTTREAAQAAHYAPRTIRRLAEEGVIAARKSVSGEWLISRHSLEKHVRARLDKRGKLGQF